MPSVYAHHITAFNRNVANLAGFQYESLVAPLFRQESDRGEIASFDTIGQDPDENNDGATETAWADIDSYADYVNGATGTFSDFLATRTPHNEVLKERSLVSPLQIEWGYNFRKVDEVAELTDPTSRVMRQGMGRCRTSVDKFALSALTAANVLRGKSTADAANVAFPATQILTSESAQTYTTEDGAKIAQRFEEEYIDIMKEDVIALISPEMKRKMRAADPSIRSRDFVDSYEIFKEFKLPKIDGITYVTHPRVTQYKDAAAYDRVVAFTREGMVWNEFDPVESFLDRNPDARYEYQAYIRQLANAVRIDDKRVVWMDITA